MPQPGASITARPRQQQVHTAKQEIPEKQGSNENEIEQPKGR
jgi:hypothetical protein